MVLNGGFGRRPRRCGAVADPAGGYRCLLAGPRAPGSPVLYFSDSYSLYALINTSYDGEIGLGVWAEPGEDGGSVTIRELTRAAGRPSPRLSSFLAMLLRRRRYNAP